MNLSQGSSAPTSEPLVKTFSKIKKCQNIGEKKLYFMSYFDLNTEIIIWTPMNFDLA